MGQRIVLSSPLLSRLQRTHAQGLWSTQRRGKRHDGVHSEILAHHCGEGAAHGLGGAGSDDGAQDRPGKTGRRRQLEHADESPLRSTFASTVDSG